MADHSKPLTTSTYANFVTELDGRFDDLTLGLDPATTSPTNLATNAIRFSSAVSKWQKYNGTTWADLASSYAININGTVGATTPAAGTFTTLSSTGNTTLGNASGDTVTITGTIQPGVVVSGSSTTDMFRITQTGTGNAFVVEDAANPDSTPFVVDSSGKVLVATTTPKTTGVGSAVMQIFGGTAPLSFYREADSTTPINLEFAKARAAGAILASGDTIGRAYFSGSDGTNQIPAAYIDAAVDGTPGNNDMPGRLVFSTTADGASTPTERMRITSTGNVGIGTLTPTQKLDVAGTIAVNGLATKQILAVHTASTSTSYTRTSTTDAAFGASLTITPVSASSRFFVFARMSGSVVQSGGDNDARAYLDACVRNSDGTYTEFAETTDTNLGVLNGGTDVGGSGDITAIIDTNARYSSNLNIRHFGSCTFDGTAGQVTTLTANSLQVIAVEYI